MGKKVKKKVRSGHKEKRVSTVPASPTTVSQLSIPSTTIPDDGVSVVKERRVCAHLEQGIDLDELSLKIGSSGPLACEDCREGVLDRRAGKGKGKHGKKKGGSSADSKPESKAIWVCLKCGHFSCGGAGFPTVPQSHAVQHARKYHHPLAIKFKNLNLRWCFLCNTLIPVGNPEENGEQKDMFVDVVKIFKAPPLEEAADIEDVWFGSGSVISKIESENTVSSSLDGRGGYVVRGLVNLGNTCFFNSVMQNLFAIDKLRDYFLKLDRSVGPLTVSLKKLFIESSPDAGLRSVINPKPFFGCVCSQAPQFRGCQQHDSHELLRCLLDGLSTEDSNARIQTNSADEGGICPNPVPTFVDAIFGGQLSSTVTCLECGHSSIVYEPFLDLSLPVPTKRPLSRKAQSVSRAKKPKIPPRRSGRIRSKVNRYADPVPPHSVSNLSTSGKSSCPVLSSEPVTEKVVASAGDSTPLESIDQSTGCDNRGSTSQDLSATQGLEKKEFFLSDMKKTAVSLEDLTWLDFLEPGTASNDHDMDSQINDISAAEDIGDKNAVQSDRKKTVVSLENLTWLDHLEPGTMSNEHHMDSQTNDNSVAQDIRNKDAVQNDVLLQNSLDSSRQVHSVVTEETTPLSSSSTCLDYLEPVKISDDHDMASQISDISVIQDPGNNKDAVQNDLFLRHSSESGSQVYSMKSNLKMDYLEDSWKEELPLRVQDSEVLLLPYKEDTSTTGEMLRGEGDITSSPVGCEQDSLDFEGFGDLFNEPEVAVGPSVSPLSSDNTSKANKVAETGFMTGNKSESDPDEVDNTDSPVSVESCLAYFTKSELLTKNEHAWHCENCSKAVRGQKIRVRKKQQKPTSKVSINCGEDRNQNSPLCLGKDCPFPTGVTNLSNGNIKTDVLGCSDENLVPDNGEVDGHQNCILETSQNAKLNLVASLEEVKCETNDALPELSQPSTWSKTCNHEIFSCQASDSCSVNEPGSAGSNTDKVQQSESQFFAGLHKSEVSEDDKIDSVSEKVKRDATKRIFINRAPPILTIHLKRFSQDTRGCISKLNGHVDFRDTLDLRPYMDPRCTERDKYKYRLVGVVEHLGTMRGGHYVAYVRGVAKSMEKAEEEIEDFVWYHASDAYVRQASLDEVLRCEAYVLFYEEI